MERAVALERSDVITVASLPGAVQRGEARRPGGGGAMPQLPHGFDLEQHVQGVEREYILEALRRSNGVKKNAAELLGLSFRQFRYLLKKYSIQ